jgi:peroxin-14
VQPATGPVVLRAQPNFSWYQAFLAAGLLLGFGASAAVFIKVFFPTDLSLSPLFACCETFSSEIQSYNHIGIACLEQKLLLPRLKSWIRNVVAEGSETADKQLKSKIDEETAEAVKASASAVSAIVKTNQELLASKDEGSISIMLVHDFSPLYH